MRKFATVSKVGQGRAVSAKADLLRLLTPDDAKSPKQLLVLLKSLRRNKETLMQ